jgi:predicted nucleic acid-binding Zn ribbon protein
MLQRLAGMTAAPMTAAPLSTVAALRKLLEAAGIEFIDENGGGPASAYDTANTSSAKAAHGG